METIIYPDTSKIKLYFIGASVPPPYHRSYEIVADPDSISFQISCYGELLHKGTIPFDNYKFLALLDQITSLGIQTKAAKGNYPPGGETLNLDLYRSGVNYLSVEIYGNEFTIFDGTTDTNLYLIKEEIEKLIPNFSSLIAHNELFEDEDNNKKSKPCWWRRLLKMT